MDSSDSPTTVTSCVGLATEASVASDPRPHCRTEIGQTTMAVLVAVAAVFASAVVALP